MEEKREMPAETGAASALWYQNVSLEDAEVYIAANLKSAVRSVIAVGYYLKCVRDGELYREAGFENIWDYARDRFGFSVSTASRYMSRNDRFSKGGNSPVIAERYQDFNKSQLQEMLSLDEEQLEQVTPDMTVQQIREIRKPREIPYIEIPGQIELDFPGIEPEDVENASQAREEVTATADQPKQAYTVSAQDLLPEPQEAGGEAVAISQLKEQEPAQSGKCIHRPEFLCTLADTDKSTAGNGDDCTHSCCWNCAKHGDCRIECYASSNRSEPGVAEVRQMENKAPFFTSELSNDNAYGYTWAQVVKTYLAEVHKARTSGETEGFQEAVFSSYGREYQASVKGTQVAFLMEGEIQFIVDAERLNGEYNFFYPESLSVYGSVKTFDRSILEGMIQDTAEFLEQMQDYWIENQPDTYTKYVMQLQAYKMLLESHEREEGE